MNKISMFILSGLLVLSMGTSAMAMSTETQDSPMMVKSAHRASQEILSDSEYKEVLERVHSNAVASITLELKEKVEQLRADIESGPLSYTITPLASYDSVSLEALLCTNDGLSVVDIYDIGWTHANAARNEAIDLYTDTTSEMKRDAFRHMTWNFRSIKDVGEHKTRVATINHEWAYLILPEVQAYEDERIDYYFDKYESLIIIGAMDYNTIVQMAKSDGDAFAISYRDELIQECKDSKAVFNNTFSHDSYIMDFWNNKVGRDYGKLEPTSTTDDVFTTAWNDGDLIKNEGSAVTSTKRSTLWSSNWWLP